MRMAKEEIRRVWADIVKAIPAVMRCAEDLEEDGIDYVYRYVYAMGAVELLVAMGYDRDWLSSIKYELLEPILLVEPKEED